LVIVSERLKAIQAERIELLGQFVESLESADDVEAAWTVEIRRSLDELHAGKAELVGWAEARATIRGSRP
jgi:hypothetical protein